MKQQDQVNNAHFAFILMFMMAKVVQVVQTVPVVLLAQVIRLARVIQVVRRSGGQMVKWSGGQMIRVVSRVATLDDMLSENIWFSCPKSPNN